MVREQAIQQLADQRVDSVDEGLAVVADESLRRLDWLPGVQRNLFVEFAGLAQH